MLLSPISGFLTEEILQNQSTHEVAKALIRYIGRYGARNFFISDLGSNFLPFATQLSGKATPDRDHLPERWNKRLKEDLSIVQQFGSKIWIVFPKGRHSAVNRIEVMVGKVKGILRSTGVLKKLKTGQI